MWIGALVVAAALAEPVPCGKFVAQTLPSGDAMGVPVDAAVNVAFDGIACGDERLDIELLRIEGGSEIPLETATYYASPSTDRIQVLSIDPDLDFEPGARHRIRVRGESAETVEVDFTVGSTDTPDAADVELTVRQVIRERRSDEFAVMDYTVERGADPSIVVLRSEFVDGLMRSTGLFPAENADLSTAQVPIDESGEACMQVDEIGYDGRFRSTPPRCMRPASSGCTTAPIMPLGWLSFAAIGLIRVRRR